MGESGEWALPARLRGHHHVDGIHTNAHDIDNGLSCFCIGQAADAERLQAGGVTGRHVFWVIREPPGVLLEEKGAVQT